MKVLEFIKLSSSCFESQPILGRRSGGFFCGAYPLFPYERVGQIAEAYLEAEGYDAKIDEVGPALGVGVNFSSVRLRPIEKGADGSPAAPILLDEVTVRLAPFALLFGTQAGSLTADLFDGEVVADVAQTGKRQKVEVEASDISMSRLPGIKESINLPLSGTLGLSLELAMKGGAPNTADGVFELVCDSCVIGDGKAKLKIKGDPFLAAGLPLPEINLGRPEGESGADKGRWCPGRG